MYDESMDPHISTLPSSLSRWIISVLGDGAAGLAERNRLAVLVLAEAKSGRSQELPNPSDDALQAWKAILDSSARDLLQARVALTRSAKRAGWSDEQLGLLLGVDGAKVAETSQADEEQLINSHPGVSSSAHKTQKP